METIIKVKVISNPKFEIGVTDNFTEELVENPTAEAVKIANDDFKKNLHEEVLFKVKDAIRIIIEEDDLLEENYIECKDDFKEDYGISIEVIKEGE